MRKDLEVAVGDAAGQIYGGIQLSHCSVLNFADTIQTEAGRDTLLASVHTFILAMLHHPEVQRKAQAELDRVLHHDRRLPSYEDQIDLPYLTAVMKEVLRWQPVAPIGTPCDRNRNRHCALM